MVEYPTILGILRDMMQAILPYVNLEGRPDSKVHGAGVFDQPNCGPTHLWADMLAL